MVYDGGTAELFQNTKFNIGDGADIFYDRFGNIKYISVKHNVISEPGRYTTFPITSETQVIRNGIYSSVDEVKATDVCYYIDKYDILLVYNKSITGVYEKAYPTKDNIKTVTVSGVDYVIDHANAQKKLSSGGEVDFGDTVTLLFGKDDTVVDIVSAKENESLIGYLVDCSIASRVTESGNTVYEYTVQVPTPDGNLNFYSADKDYTDYEGRIVKVSFQCGKALMNYVRTENTVSGTFNWSSKTLGNYKLSEDINIIDVMKTDYENTAGRGKKIFPQRLNKSTLSSSDILYANVDNGEITELILNDYTGDIYDYGIVLKAENSKSDKVLAGRYQLNVKGNILQYATTNKIYSVSTGNVVAFDAIGTNPILMKKINSYSGKVTEVDDMYAYIGNGKYLLSDDVVIYNQVSNTVSGTGLRYEIIEKDDIDYEKSVTAYYDKTENKGGRIRIIVVKK